MKRVLIVEDSATSRQLLAGILAHAGYQAAQAKNGLEGLLEMARDLPDAVVLDLLMPVATGAQFLAVRAANPAWCAVPVIVMTAAEPPWPVLPGAYRVLAKPADPAELLAALAEATLSRSDRHGPDQ